MTLTEKKTSMKFESINSSNNFENQVCYTVQSQDIVKTYMLSSDRRNTRKARFPKLSHYVSVRAEDFTCAENHCNL